MGALIDLVGSLDEVIVREHERAGRGDEKACELWALKSTYPVVEMGDCPAPGPITGRCKRLLDNWLEVAQKLKEACISKPLIHQSSTHAPSRASGGPCRFIGQILDTAKIICANLLKSLALPRGIEPLFSP